MKRLDKILLNIILCVGLVFSVVALSLFYPVPFIQNMVQNCQIVFPWFNEVLAVYHGIVGLCFFILILIVCCIPSKSNFLIVINGKGKLQFSKRTIESTVKYSFADVDAINFAIIKVKIHKDPNKTKVYVKLSLNDTSELTTLTEGIQEKIASALQTSLGITAKTITIKVTESEPKNMPEKENREDFPTDRQLL